MVRVGDQFVDRLVIVDERQDRMERLRARVFTSTADSYCRNFLAALAA